jgi:hypothetical protein
MVLIIFNRLESVGLCPIHLFLPPRRSQSYRSVQKQIQVEGFSRPPGQFKISRDSESHVVTLEKKQAKP